MTENCIVVDLPENHHAKLNKDIEDRLRYQVEGLKSIIFNADNTTATITIQAKDENEQNLAKDKIGEILNQVTFLPLEFNESVLYEHAPKYLFQDVIEEAKALDLLYEYAPGVYSYRGFLFNLKQYLDQLFTDLALKIGAKAIELPSFILTSDLLKTGHFETFPHHVYLSGHIDFIKEKCQIKKSDDSFKLKEVLNHHTTHSDFCLTPSVCYNYYRSLQDKMLKSFEETIVTAKCRCFRYELSTVSAFQRQREFEMREIIFLGSPDRVAGFREMLLKKIWEIAVSFDLKSRVQNAFDPFFTENLGPRAAVQFNRNMKFELVANYEKNKDVAISSFNIHSSTFGKAFNIKDPEGKITNSGCIGFGLERWVLCLIAKYGLTKSQWPSEFHHLF